MGDGAEVARIAGARVDRIAAAAQANKRLIYDCFGDKHGPFEAVAEAYIDRIIAAVPGADAGRDLAPYCRYAARRRQSSGSLVLDNLIPGLPPLQAARLTRANEVREYKRNQLISLITSDYAMVHGHERASLNLRGC